MIETDFPLDILARDSGATITCEDEYGIRNCGDVTLWGEVRATGYKLYLLEEPDVDIEGKIPEYYAASLADKGVDGEEMNGDIEWIR